jgi:16S rRNA (uracil1498-N3)-methyltransferase
LSAQLPRIDFASPRLFVDAPLSPQARLALDPAQTNYLRNVLRFQDGAGILVFNGRDGEWRAKFDSSGRKSAFLIAAECVRVQPPPFDLHYLFAPLKHARLDYMVQKAVEMGAGRLQPILTRRTQAERVNLERMRANAIEAAEQCGILSIPDIAPPVRLAVALEGWSPGRMLVFCDEDAPVQDPIAALGAIGNGAPPSLAVLIGPEGGFDPQEREALMAMPRTLRLSLGPRILRADTAAVAAIALIQAGLGDWRGAR